MKLEKHQLKNLDKIELALASTQVQVQRVRAIDGLLPEDRDKFIEAEIDQLMSELKLLVKRDIPVTLMFLEAIPDVA